MAIEAILPLASICRGVAAFLFWRKIELTTCVPRVLFKISNIAPFSLPVAEFYLFRTHYVVMYIALLLSMALIAYEQKTQRISQINLCGPELPVVSILAIIPFLAPTYIAGLLLRYNELRLFTMNDTTNRQ